jgi:hypothetical protein
MRTTPTPSTILNHPQTARKSPWRRTNPNVPAATEPSVEALAVNSSIHRKYPPNPLSHQYQPNPRSKRKFQSQKGKTKAAHPADMEWNAPSPPVLIIIIPRRPSVSRNVAMGTSVAVRTVNSYIPSRFSKMSMSNTPHLPQP